MTSTAPITREYDIPMTGPYCVPKRLPVVAPDRVVVEPFRQPNPAKIPVRRSS